MGKEKIKKVKNLAQQILDKAIEEDKLLKISLKKSKLSHTIGDSWMVFHPSLLKELLNEID